MIAAMLARVLDTNYLLDIWHGRTPGRVKVRSAETAHRAARDWLRLFPKDSIITPVRLEFIGGTNDRDELRLSDLFLGEFRVLDEGRVLPEDWREAERLARWVPRTGRKRDAIDCLSLAICDRLHAELLTRDRGVPG